MGRSRLTSSSIKELERFGKANSFETDQIRNHVVKVEARDPRREPETAFSYVDIAGIDNRSGKVSVAKQLHGKDAPSRARRVIHTNDVIVSTVRPNLNATALVPEWLDNQICSTGFCVLRCRKSLAPQYLYAFTRTKDFVDTLSNK